MADATFAMVENLDYSVGETYTVTGPGNLSVFDATTGRWTAKFSNQVTLNLLPGGGMLVGLTSLVSGPGDANRDGMVNFTDLNIVLTNYNQPGGWSQGDFNGDGIVNFADLNILLTNYNHSLASNIVPAYDGLDAEAIRACPWPE